MAPIPTNATRKRARDELEIHTPTDASIAPSLRSSKRSAGYFESDDMDTTDDCFRILEQSGRVQLAQEEPVTSQSVARQLYHLSLPRGQTAQRQPSKKRQADAQPGETPAAAEPITPSPRKKWRGVDKRSAKKLTDLERLSKQRLAGSSPAIKTPVVKQQALKEEESCTTSILQEYKEVSRQQRQESCTALDIRRSVASSMDNHRKALHSPEKPKRKRNDELQPEQVERELSRRRTYTEVKNGSASGERQVQPAIKREGYGFSYTDPSFQSFDSTADEDEDAEIVTPRAQVAGSQQRPGGQHRSAFEVSLQKSPPQSQRTVNNPETGQQVNWSFSSTASTIADDDDDMVVMRDVGSFHIAKPQRALPCTVATREDTIRLKARAKVLLDKNAKSSDIQAGLLWRLERMVRAAREQNANFGGDVPTLLSQAMKIQRFLLRTQQERIETGELRSIVEHESEWVKWVVEACRTQVMHMKTGDCTCPPSWEDDQ
ncbi:hypothetical protein NX059_002124 [Plenodomus lindquistii]|nr:hypothetical protein NX059_002124 [Plenodomus lindquistii]